MVLGQEPFQRHGTATGLLRRSCGDGGQLADCDMGTKQQSEEHFLWQQARNDSPLQRAVWRDGAEWSKVWSRGSREAGDQGFGGISPDMEQEPRPPRGAILHEAGLQVATEEVNAWLLCAGPCAPNRSCRTCELRAPLRSIYLRVLQITAHVTHAH